MDYIVQVSGLEMWVDILDTDIPGWDELKSLRNGDFITAEQSKTWLS